MLLWELHTDFLQNVSHISLKGGEQSTTSIDDDESEFLVILEQVLQAGGVELILTLVHFVLDWSEWLDVEGDPLFGLVVVHQNLSAEDQQTVSWDVFIQLQLFSS